MRHVQASDTENTRRAMEDSASRSFVQGKVLAQASLAEKKMTTYELRVQSLKEQKRALIDSYWQAWNRSLEWTLGSLDINSDHASQIAYGVIGAIPGHWRMDKTEDFTRMRRKLVGVFLAVLFSFVCTSFFHLFWCLKVARTGYNRERGG